jgi:hypothetical protein
MPPPRVPAVSGLPPEAAKIVQAIAKGNSKSAVDAAKLLHKRLGTPASEELLVDAYCARIRSMLENRMTAEAEALVRLVRELHPAFAARLDRLRGERIASGAGLDELVRPLADPATPAEVRTSIEATLRTSLTEPAILASCNALPADHPLRRAADAVARAFNAVTSGPVDDAVLALPEVSRRSPLAPWKPLLRAIASYYRHEDAAGLEHVRTIDPASAPARLAPALETLLGAGGAHQLKPAAARLAAQSGGFGDLRSALKAIDRAFELHDHKPLYPAIRAAVAVAQQQCPEILPSFRRQVAALAAMQDRSATQVAAAMGGAPKSDAHFHLLLARGLEATGAPPALVCHMWEYFRGSAIAGGWFPAQGPEVAVLYLHMAELAGQIDPAELAAEQRDAHDPARWGPLDGGGAGEPALDHLHAGALFERAAAMDPCVAVFERWTNWALPNNRQAAAQAAAEAWMTAIPTDPRPLLHLMRMAEERGALKKALGYLGQAEALDGVNTEVRRARLRLLIRGAIRHLKQGKPLLAEPELAELEDLPQAREHDRPAFVAALRHVAALQTKDKNAEAAAAAKVAALLGQPREAALALTGAATLCGLPALKASPNMPGTWIEAIPRICEMGWDLDLKLAPPKDVKQAASQEVSTASAAALERFGRTVIRLGWKDVAFSVSAAGLAKGKRDEARFLLLRALSFSNGNIERREECLEVVVELARRGGDTGLAAEAAERWRETSAAAAWGGEPRAPYPRHIKAVLKRERAARRPPSDPYDPFEDDDFPFDLGPDAGPGLDLGHLFPPRPGRRRRSPRPIDNGQETLF